MKYFHNLLKEKISSLFTLLEGIFIRQPFYTSMTVLKPVKKTP
jgi:hypothetical protein